MRLTGHRAWPAAAAAAVVVGGVGAFIAVPRTDTTWLLHVTDKLLDGATLGVDVVENSPPVILWLKVPVVLLARATGWDAWLLWVVAVTMLGVGALILAGRLLRAVPSLAGAADLLAAVFAVGLFLLPLLDFGQREHVTVALVVPWLLAVAARAEGSPLPTGWATAAALGGGLGLSIKPHFGLVWLLVAGVLLVRERSARTLVAPELTAAALVPGLAILATFLLHPDWLGYARLYGPLYLRFGYENPFWIGLVGEGIEWSWLGILALLAFAPAIRPWPGSLSVLAAALVGFHLAAILQAKGWGYHFLPASTVGLFVAAAAATCANWSGDRLVRRLYRVAVPLGIAVVAGGGVWRAVELLALPERKWEEADPSLRALVREVGRSGRTETLLLLSINISAGFPLTYLTGSDWTSRHPSLWALAAVYPREFRRRGMVPVHPPAGRPADERRIATELEADIVKRPPTMVILPRPEPEGPIWAGSQRFDYRAYFAGPAGEGSVPCLDGPPRPVEAYLVWRCERQ
ncbi:MAG TPA: hypothetical protein VJ773_02465 [Gemmatimonadales bacterium]|nr:hypothetical protein [Gemmatimonadales bacterium]